MNIIIKKLFFFLSVCFYITTFLINNSVHGSGPDSERVYKRADDLFKELAQRYDLKSCNQIESEEDDDNTKVCKDSGDNEYFYSKLEDRCNESKKKAIECCTNPSACTNVMTAIGKGTLTIAPSILSAFNTISVSRKLNKNKDLTRQERSDKMCSSHNKFALGKFASDLIGQFMPAFEKDCADRIKQCKKKCGKAVKAFEQDLRKVLNTIEKGSDGRGYQIKHTVQKAHDCLYGSEVNFNDILFKNPSADDTPFEVGRKKLHTGDLKCDGPNSKFYSQVLFYTKAYYNTMKDRNNIFAFNEEEVIGCADIESRVVGNNKNVVTHPVTQPILAICEQIANDPNYANPNSPAPDNSVTVPGSGIDTASFLGDGPNTKTHPLLFTENKYDDPGGVLGPDDGGIPTGKKKPDPSKNPPGFKGGGPSSSSPGGPGGGGGPGPGGGSGSPDEEGEYYEDDSYPGSFGSGGFRDPNSGFFAPSGDSESRSSNWGDRELAGDEEDEEEDLYDNENNDPMDSESGKSIFDMASKNIQYFCTNLKCSL